MKKFLKVLLIIIICVVVIAIAYLGYVLISFHRIGDMDLEVSSVNDKIMNVDDTYSIMSYNTGFGAYEPDYSFFMDGGEYSWAVSEEGLKENVNNIGDFLASQNKDFYLLQEVDFDSTRTYHFDEREVYKNKLSNHNCVWAQNYDSPFLFYPFSQPHGASKSSIMTFSKFGIDYSKRVELPIEDGFTKFLDLDRCYSKSYISLDNGKYLVLYNFHLSAYTSDGKIATKQLELLVDDLQDEYNKGNYCIAGGDFNKDIVGNSNVYYSDADKSDYTWAQNIDKDYFIGKDIELIAPFDKDNPIPSCRNTDVPLDETEFYINIDGYLVSKNVQVNESKVIDSGFVYSDHNPVSMEFKLK